MMLAFLTHLAVLFAGITTSIASGPRAPDGACYAFNYTYCRNDGSGNAELRGMEPINPNHDLDDLGTLLALKGSNGCSPGALLFNIFNVETLTVSGISCENLPAQVGPQPLELCKYFNGDCVTTRRHLLSKKSTTFHGGEKEYVKILQACGDHEYDGAIYVDSHMYAVAAPKDQAAAAGCPFVAAHSMFSEKKQSVKKKVDVFKGASQQRISDHLEEGEYLPIGTFKLSDLARAFEKADASESGNAAYDVITNNCSKFLISLANQLDVKIDGRITSFIARRLITTSGKTLADQIRSSASSVTRFFGRSLRGENDADLISNLVESVAAKLY